MNSIVLKREHEAVGPAKSEPAISIIQSFDKKAYLTKELDHKLKIALGKAERDLLANYPATQAIPIIKRLHYLSRQLKYDPFKKSAAIFVSARVEKVFYLDIAVEDKIVIDESFEIGDLVHSKKLSARYLILILNAVSFKIYLCRSSAFTLLKTETTEGVSNAADSGSNRKLMSDQFLHRADKEVFVLLKAYSLPVFVMGAKRQLQQFKHLTKCGESIAEYIYGSYMKENSAHIYKVLKPHLAGRENQQNIICYDDLPE